MNELTKREVAIFVAAGRLSHGERATYLDETCVGDPELRRRLDELLEVDKTAGEFLERPANEILLVMAMADLATRRPVPASEKSGDRIGFYKLLQHYERATLLQTDDFTLKTIWRREYLLSRVTVFVYCLTCVSNFCITFAVTISLRIC
jgi:hypothetical protein